MRDNLAQIVYVQLAGRVKPGGSTGESDLNFRSPPKVKTPHNLSGKRTVDLWVIY